MPADDPRLFAGWYENDQCVSKEEELTVQVGMVDRSLEARFFDDGLMVVNGGNVIVNDQNKVDGPAVILHHGSLTVEGNEIWKPKSFAYYRDASLLVDAERYRPRRSPSIGTLGVTIGISYPSPTT